MISVCTQYYIHTHGVGCVLYGTEMWQSSLDKYEMLEIYIAFGDNFKLDCHYNNKSGWNE